MAQNNKRISSVTTPSSELRIREIKRLLNVKDMKDAQGVRLSISEYKRVRRDLLDELGILEKGSPVTVELLSELFHVAICLAEDVHPDDISPQERMVLQRVADFMNVNLDKLLPTS